MIGPERDRGRKEERNWENKERQRKNIEKDNETERVCEWELDPRGCWKPTTRSETGRASNTEPEAHKTHTPTTSPKKKAKKALEFNKTTKEEKEREKRKTVLQLKNGSLDGSLSGKSMRMWENDTEAKHTDFKEGAMIVPLRLSICNQPQQTAAMYIISHAWLASNRKLF